MRKHLILASLSLVAVMLVSCKKEDAALKEYNSAAKGYFTEWPSYNPTIHYNFNDENAGIAEPTKNLPYSSNLYRVVSDGYWSFFIGKNANSLVKDNDDAAYAMLKQLNEDFAYITDVMGWPRDYCVQQGYRSAVFLFGSGLSTDSASNTDKGGWQSAVTVNGKSWPIILLSYYPVYCFDPACPYSDKEYQTSAVTHEGIHAVFASMPGCRKASWFHEGANVWLQATMNYERKYGKEYVADDFGWLSMASIMCPFMPIECYSGWLTDGTFGGPGAQGVNQNFRQTIGGAQYSEVFPTFLGEIVDYMAVPWVWMNATGYVLEGIAEQIGVDQMHRMIQEYRARLALSDMGKYSQAVKNMYNNHMGQVYGSDVDGVYVTPWRATPYEPTTVDEDGWLVPDQETTPGWSGANIIPIKVESGPVIVEFKPNGDLSTTENMSCQICYRATDGTTVYCNPFSEGKYAVEFDEYQPANGVIFAVVCNLDYTFTGNASIRKNHYDYRLRLSDNASPANVYANWFNYDEEVQ